MRRSSMLDIDKDRLTDEFTKRGLSRSRIEPKWGITELTGYVPKTTFWDDFSIADAFGLDAVKDTYNRAFKAWKTDVVYLTELVMVLNHKIWQHYEKNDALARLYNDLWEKAQDYGYENLKDGDLTYFIQTLD